MPRHNENRGVSGLFHEGIESFVAMDWWQFRDWRDGYGNVRCVFWVVLALHLLTVCIPVVYQTELNRQNELSKRCQ